MNHVRTLLASVALAALASAPAHAADLVPLRGPVADHPSGADSGLYVALRGGFTRGDTTEFALGGIDGLAVETDYDTGGLVIGAVGVSRGGLRGEVEVSYARYGVDTHALMIPDPQVTGSDPTRTRNVFSEDASFGTASALSLMASAYYDLSLGRFKPFAGVGVGVGRLQAEDFGVDLTGVDLTDVPLAGGVTSATVLHDESWGLAYHASVGTAVSLTDKFALELAYRYQGIEAELDTVTDAETEVELTSHNLFAGVRLHF